MIECMRKHGDIAHSHHIEMWTFRCQVVVWCDWLRTGPISSLFSLWLSCLNIETWSMKRTLNVILYGQCCVSVGEIGDISV